MADLQILENSLIGVQKQFFLSFKKDSVWKNPHHYFSTFKIDLDMVVYENLI